jgi:tRNA-specific 2-thiouridylase
VAFFTVGQRRGLGVGGNQPLYVIDLDPEKNEVIVGNDGDLWSHEVDVERVNLIAVDRLTAPRRVLAKVRYAQAPAPASLIPRGEGRVRLRFDDPQRAVAPGQAAVFYDSVDPDLVVGGGTILRRGCAGNGHEGGEGPPGSGHG